MLGDETPEPDMCHKACEICFARGAQEASGSSEEEDSDEVSCSEVEESSEEVSQ